MKAIVTLLALCAALALLAGCASTPDKEQRCASYAQVYELYLASTQVRTVSKEEIAAATAAAIFLQAYCGWTDSTSEPGTRGLESGPEVDGNGVPVIHPPK
jgi:hypothetical protein